MSSWLRLRVGPVGYTVGGRRRPQTYGQYKQSREQREAHAARFAREESDAAEKLRRQQSGEALQPSDKLMVAAAVLLVVLVSPIALPVYVVRRVRREWRELRGTAPQNATDVSFQLTPARGPRGAAPAGVAHALPPAPARAPRRGSVADAPRARGWTIKGLTTAEFDTVTLPTLRYWLEFWNDDVRSAGRAEEMARESPESFAGRTRADHIRMIAAEIDARTTG